MTGPRTKRQFAGASADPSQRQITTYFGNSSTAPSDHPSSSHARPATSSAAAAQASLPASTQSSLLNVGMRIRKSVPEGYKTGSAYSGFKLWDEREDTTMAVPRRRKAATGTVAHRELMPFCGIHSVGGISSQPAFAPELDDVPGLTSSQESVESIFDEDVGNAKKRFYADEADEEELQLPLRLFGSATHQPGSSMDAGNTRVMAVPRRKGRKSLPNGADVQDVDQENMAVDDFEEAAFLDAAVFSPEMDI